MGMHLPKGLLMLMKSSIQILLWNILLMLGLISLFQSPDNIQAPALCPDELKGDLRCFGCRPAGLQPLIRQL